MRTTLVRSALTLCMLCAALAGASPSAAAAAEETTPAPAPAAGKLKLVLQRVGGNPLFAAAGHRFVVRGIVLPYVAGQSVQVTLVRDGREASSQTVAVVPVGNGAGQFHIGLESRDAGQVQVKAAHAATSAQAAFSAHTRAFDVVHTNVSPGSHGFSVRALQSELWHLHYATSLNGLFDEATGRALVAYRKMMGLERVPAAGSRVFALLARGAGAFHVRYRHDGRHVEADLTRQVLAEIEPGGRIHDIYPISSGKPSTPTVLGRFSVYLKTPGTNSEGMVDSNYFIRGYAIHGYAEVPTYAASHGCLRVPIPDAAAIYAWVQYGTPVDVYYEDGRASARVSNDAGP